MFNFWISDHAVFLTKFAKLAQCDVDWHGTAASRCWFGAILCNIVLDTLAYRKKAKSIVSDEKDESETAEEDDDDEASPEAELLGK